MQKLILRFSFFFVAFALSFGDASAVEPVEIGIGVRNLNETESVENKVPFGVLINRIFPDSPAANADLRAGDIILAIDGSPVTNTKELLAALIIFQPEDRLSLTVFDRGRELVVSFQANGIGATETKPPRQTADGTVIKRRYYKRSKKSRGPAPATEGLCASGECTPVKVYYGTDRKGMDDPVIGRTYSGDRIGEDGIETGICWVTIPKTHEVGEIEVPSVVKLEFRQDPAKHMILARTDLLDADSFFTAAREDLEAAPSNSALIYVHGYWNSFQTAAQRTAQLAFDLKFKGLPVFFSWPSQGSFSGYTYDETNVEWAATDLRRFLQDFIEKTGVEEVYIIAHSMGNRALLKAIAPLISNDAPVTSKISEIVLAAPDIDADVFKREIAPIFTGSPALTLYASSGDWALRASRLFHGFPRAGDTKNGLTIVENVVTIDASNVATDWLGHGYFSQSQSIISDIDQIFSGATNPDSRENMSAGDFNGERYWVLAD